MVRYLGWLANTVLFTLCCFLVADTANAIIAALLSQSPARAVESGPRSGLQSRSWDDRQQITQRNLFHSAKLAAPVSAPTAPTDEELKETKLPLKLWGTIAADDPALSWASVEETGKSVIAAVRVGDKIQSATIVGIERRRVVLLENGSRRSLSLDDDDAGGKSLASSKRSKPTTRKTTSRSSRRRSSAKTPRKPAGRDKESPEGNPSSLYSQARIVPKIDPETNVVTGLQLSAIQSGSAFEEAGIQNGEIITEINGVPVSDMGASTKIMAALTDSDQVEVVTVNENGDTKIHRIATPR
jgi:general secretion pathway protein C